MTCPRCFTQLDEVRGVCPECGVNLYQNVSGIVKTSAVMISTGGESGFYDSVQEVPERLRKQLLETTASQNSGTIVIADRAGKEHLTQVLARRDSSRESAAATPAPAEDAAPAPPDAGRRYSWIAWAAFTLILLLAATLSAFFGLRW
jgi:hypothetical protein